jgi:hypothetical protein
MKPFKSTMALLALVAGTVVSGTATADHRDWRGRPHAYRDGGYVVVPPARRDVTVGFVAGGPAYYYEPAPRYYYAPEPSGYYYYYEDSSAFPRSNSGD